MRSRRDTSQASSQITAMIAQVVTTVLVITTGPSLTMGSMSKFPSTTAYSFINR